MSDESWMARGACRVLRLSPDLFFQQMGRHTVVTAAAKRACAHCPVSEECREYAIDNNIRDGIWGGMTERERRALRRRRILLDRAI